MDELDNTIDEKHNEIEHLLSLWEEYSEIYENSQNE